VDGLAGFREVPLKTHAAIVQAAAAGEIEYGVIAVENTLDGIIVESIRELERLFETETVKRPYICWEELLPIRHLLISRTGRFGDVRRIASHASALRQCSRFLGAVQQARPEIEFTQALSTGDGVEQALGDEGVAAMASPEALERHEPALREVALGEAMASGELKWDDGAWLTDVRGGLTRFWILGPQPMPPMRGARVRIRRSTGKCEGRKAFGERDDEAAVIERIRQLRRKPVKGTRLSFAGIAAKLNAEGVPTRTGSPWRPSTVAGILARD
jgi:hypothetical protein